MALPDDTVATGHLSPGGGIKGRLYNDKYKARATGYVAYLEKW